MNRRNFITTSLLAIPTLTMGLSLPKNNDENEDSTFKLILTPDQLRCNEIRHAPYTANCFDINGIFGHECGYNEKISMPFVTKTYKLHNLPKIFKKQTDIQDVINYYLDCNQYNIMKSVINEIKENMEYVNMVAYVQCPCLCGSNNCKDKHWIPIVRGLTKEKYNIEIQSMIKNNYV